MDYNFINLLKKKEEDAYCKYLLVFILLVHVWWYLCIYVFIAYSLYYLYFCFLTKCASCFMYIPFLLCIIPTHLIIMVVNSCIASVCVCFKKLTPTLNRLFATTANLYLLRVFFSRPVKYSILESKCQTVLYHYFCKLVVAKFTCSYQFIRVVLLFIMFREKH